MVCVSHWHCSAPEPPHSSILAPALAPLKMMASNLMEFQSRFRLRRTNDTEASWKPFFYKWTPSAWPPLATAFPRLSAGNSAKKEEISLNSIRNSSRLIFVVCVCVCVCVDVTEDTWKRKSRSSDKIKMYSLIWFSIFGLRFVAIISVESQNGDWIVIEEDGRFEQEWRWRGNGSHAGIDDGDSSAIRRQHHAIAYDTAANTRSSMNPTVKYNWMILWLDSSLGLCFSSK